MDFLSKCYLLSGEGWLLFELMSEQMRGTRGLAVGCAVGSGCLLSALTSTFQACLLGRRHLRAFISGFGNHSAHRQGKSGGRVGELITQKSAPPLTDGHLVKKWLSFLVVPLSYLGALTVVPYWIMQSLLAAFLAVSHLLSPVMMSPRISSKIYSCFLSRSLLQGKLKWRCRPQP